MPGIEGGPLLNPELVSGRCLTLILFKNQFKALVPSLCLSVVPGHSKQAPNPVSSFCTDSHFCLRLFCPALGFEVTLHDNVGVKTHH